jgi:hypothetical protein
MYKQTSTLHGHNSPVVDFNVVVSNLHAPSIALSRITPRSTGTFACRTSLVRQVEMICQCLVYLDIDQL